MSSAEECEIIKRYNDAIRLIGSKINQCQICQKKEQCGFYATAVKFGELLTGSDTNR